MFRGGIAVVWLGKKTNSDGEKVQVAIKQFPKTQNGQVDGSATIEWQMHKIIKQFADSQGKDESSV
jgi:hypothetical protein